MATPRPLFVPTARQLNWLIPIACVALGEALYLRYQVIENASASLACQGGLDTWLCGTFRLSILLFNNMVFGGVALAAAVLNLLRPSIVLTGITLAAAAFGLVLHNADLSGLAAGILILSLARRAPAPE
jgi:small-conductance mechanosensitive channel